MRIFSGLAVLAFAVCLLAGCNSEPTYAPGESPKEKAMLVRPGAGGGGGAVAPAGAPAGGGAMAGGAGAGAGRPGGAKTGKMD